jgi:hypothetical protein
LKFLEFPAPALLFSAILSLNQEFYAQARSRLKSHFGEIIEEVEPQPWTQTDYYASEMGPNLIKGFLAFSPPFFENHLVDCKRFARSIEWSIAASVDGEFKRTVNIDPGCITLSKVILSTSKNFSHRIYLGSGVFAEVTLIYHPGKWEVQPWTYPDYKIAPVQTFLSYGRKHLMNYISREK